MIIFILSKILIDADVHNGFEKEKVPTRKKLVANRSREPLSHKRIEEILRVEAPA